MILHNRTSTFLLCCTLAFAGCGSSGGSGDSGTTSDDDTSGDGTTTTTGDCTSFSFFVTSYAALVQLSGSNKGLGGNLRYPDRTDTSKGAGLKGADAICAAIADTVETDSSSCKTWRAFLSVSKDENGSQVNAIDRIGNGPWYDRNCNVFATSKADLLYQRPMNCVGNANICNDFPNETGTPNHNPDGTGNVDNHDMLTGSNENGTLKSSFATCWDWTDTKIDSKYKPRVGHSWPTPHAKDNDPMANWISALDETGCAAGINFIDNGPGDPSSGTVGAGGGYGGFYCFAILDNSQ